MNLKSYLANVGITMKDFAKCLDITPHYVSGISKGYYIPGIHLAREIEKATNGVVRFDHITRPKKGSKKTSIN